MVSRVAKTTHRMSKVKWLLENMGWKLSAKPVSAIWTWGDSVVHRTSAGIYLLARPAVEVGFAILKWTISTALTIWFILAHGYAIFISYLYISVGIARNCANHKSILQMTTVQISVWQCKLYANSHDFIFIVACLESVQRKTHQSNTWLAQLDLMLLA